jgi:hypothetical protein
MQAPSGNQRITSRLGELGLILPTPPTPLGAYVESSDTGNLLFLSGILPVANGKLAISGRLGDNLSVVGRKQLSSLRLTPLPSPRNISVTWIG